MKTCVCVCFVSMKIYAFKKMSENILQNRLREKEEKKREIYFG